MDPFNGISVCVGVKSRGLWLSTFAGTALGDIVVYGPMCWRCSCIWREVPMEVYSR